MSVAIVTFDPKFRADFARLNYAWITRLFTVEPVDRRVLDNPEAEILEHGGEIFFAVTGGYAAGTVAVKRIDDRRFELTKMAVDEAWRGKGFGKLLLSSAIDYARAHGAARIELSSHTSLIPAIAMYRDAGFTDRKSSGESCYTRCNVYLEKSL